MESTNAACDGVYFGESGGSGTLAATRTITIGGGGFISGDLYLRNFTQTGATAQNLAITGAGILYNYDSDWGGNVVFSGPRMITRGTRYRGTASLTKNGATDDRSRGGNQFDGNATINCSNAGYILMGDAVADIFGADLNISNSGTRGVYIAYNSAGNTIAGNLTATNSGTGSNTWLYFSDQTASSLSISGNTSITSTATSTTQSIRFGREGDITATGNVTINRGGSSTTSDSYIAQGTNSTVSIQGDLNYTQTGGGGNGRMFIGENGDITVNGNMTLVNSSTATDSRILCNHNANSVGVYNGNIVLSSTLLGSDGVRFGTAGGSGTLAATRAISVGAGGFISGDTYFWNFTQIGATPQTFANTGTGLMYIDNSNWGGNVDFSSGRLISQFTTYQGTLALEKTSASRDESDGGNIVTGNAVITNSGSGEMRFSDGTNDVFSTDLTLNNSGTSVLYFGYRAPANTVGGNLILNNTATGTGSDISLCSIDTSGLTVTGNVIATNSATSTNSAYLYIPRVGDMNVGGNVTITNSASATNARIYLSNGNASSLAITGDLSLTGTGSSANHINYIGEQGDITIGGNLTVTQSPTGASANTYVANNALSTVIIGGNSSFENTGAGTTKRMYIGNLGDVTFNGDLNIENTSSATNSQIYCNHQPGSVNAYNGNITIENSNAASDGIFFGTSNAGGSGTLAATRTISAVGGGITAGDIYFKNFTQIGATAQSLTNSGAGYIYNWDSDWGGNVVFSSGRIVSRGTTYQGTSVLTKTGASDDRNSFGNTFTGNCTLNNQGTGYLLFGDGTADVFSANLTMNNSGTHQMYLAYNSAGNSITGDLVINNTASGATGRTMYISDLAASTLSIGGNATITNSPSNANFNVYFGDDGDVSLTGNLVINSSSAGASSTVSVAQNTTSLVTIGGNATITNTGSGATTHNSYFGNNGDVTLTGNLILNNTTTSNNGTGYIANGSNSIVTIGGSATLTNSGAGNDKRIYLAQNGDITITGTLTLSNGSSANNSHIYCNHNSGSVGTYNGNIIVESTNAASDGVWFGWSNGSATLAATRTITVAGGGFIGGDLRFRNFTQVGPTAQSLTNSGPGYIYNYDSDWGGNVTFSSGRMYTRGTNYQGTSTLTKTGASEDRSPGGNAFTGNTSLINNGTQTFSMGEGSPDTFGADLTIENNSTRYFYLARNSAGNTVGGNLTVTDNGTGTDNRIYLSDNTNSTLVVSGTTTITNSSTATSSTIYGGVSGDVTFNDNVTLINNGTGATAEIRLANGSSSSVIINGNLTGTNSASGTTKRIRFTENGDLTLSGNLSATNNSSATTGEIYIGNGSTSVVSIGGTSSFTNSGAGTTKRMYIGNYGDVSFTGDVTISNSSSATNSEIYCNDRPASINTFNGNLIVENTNASGDGVFFGNRQGTATLANTRTITIGGGGFVAGQLYFRNFTQTGGTAQALTLTGTAYMVQYDAAWGGNVDFEAPRFNTRGTTYSGTSDLEKTGTTDDASAGGNTFTGACTLRNSGSRYFLMGNGTPDTWSSDVTMINTGTHNMYIAHNSAGNSIAGNLVSNNNGTSNANVYISNENASSLTIGGNATITNTGTGGTCRTYFGRRGDITLSGDLSITNSSSAGNSHVYLNQESNSSITYAGDITLEVTNASCDGIYFGSSGGNATQSAGGSMNTGGGGYIAGDLQIRNFTQLGNSASNLTLTGTARYYPYTSTFGGNLTVTTPRYYSRTTTYNSDFSLTMTGSTNNDSYGDNTFEGDVTVNMGSSARLRLANNLANDYNGNATFTRTAGTLQPAYNQPSTFAGNINVDCDVEVTMGGNNGTVVLDGTGAQSFNDVGNTSNFTFRRLTLNKASGEFTLNEPLRIQTTTTFTNGIMNTDVTNLLILEDNATVTGASDASHVDGPVDKIGNGTNPFAFPVGDNGSYRPISMTTPGNSAQFRGQYFFSDPSAHYDWMSKEPTIDHISTTEYWTLDRIAGSDAEIITLGWDANSGGVDNLADLTVIRWDNGSGIWRDEGNGGTTGNTTSGTIQTSGNVSSFSPFTLGSSSINNPLPVDLKSFTATPNKEENVVDLFWVTSSETNNDYFTVEKTSDLQNFEEVVQVTGQGTINEETEYQEKDYNPSEGISYYRLSQTDYDGKTEYFNLEKVLFDLKNHGNDIHVQLYPNPSNGHNMFLKIPNSNNDEINVLVNDFIGKSYLTDFTVINQGDYSVVAIEMNQKLAPGSYMINVNVNGENISHKLIVQ
ncbi:MAG: T9SS type A sorting domain-containing protein [Salibacteraceae bacterium]